MLNRPCAVCGVPSRGNRCPVHRAVRAPRKPPRPKLPRQLRGYDAEYDRERRDLKTYVRVYLESGQPVACAICGFAIMDIADFSAEHVIPVRSGGQARGNLVPAHKTCNSGYRRRRRN